MTSLLRPPPGWTTCPPTDPGAVLTVVAPDASSAGPPARLSLGLVDLAHPTDLPPPAGHVEDDDVYVDAEGREVHYQRWSPTTDASRLHESWAWVSGGVVVLVTAQCDRADYLALCDALEAAAESVHPRLGART